MLDAAALAVLGYAKPQRAALNACAERVRCASTQWDCAGAASDVNGIADITLVK